MGIMVCHVDGSSCQFLFSSNRLFITGKL